MKIVARVIESQTLRKRGKYEYRYEHRGIRREVEREEALENVRRFFRRITQGGIGSILYIKGS